MAKKIKAEKLKKEKALKLRLRSKFKNALLHLKQDIKDYGFKSIDDYIEKVPTRPYQSDGSREYFLRIKESTKSVKEILHYDPHLVH